MTESIGEYSPENDPSYPHRMERARRLLVDDLTKRLDHILYTEWDPIGVHFHEDWACFDEYHAYLPKIVSLVRAGVSFFDIADQLMAYDVLIMREGASRRRCDVSAVLVSAYGPHYSKNPFIPTVNVDSPESAYQSVLDLVTQTRLDAYEKRWDKVRTGYERAIEICDLYLPERHALVGACLNNLGHAHTQLGQLDKAQQLFEKAVPKLALESHCEALLYELCLDNLISNLEHRGQFAAAVPVVRALMSHHKARFGAGDGRVWEARKRLRQLRRRDRAPVALICRRISVEHDGRGFIRNSAWID